MHTIVVRRFFARLLFLLGIAAASGCSVLKPPPGPYDMRQRLETLPLNDAPLTKDVVVRWNKNHVPYILAEDDLDAAFVLGLVQAHLRLGQMEFGKRLSQGRLSEMAGPIASDIDAALRALGFGRAAQASYSAMPDWSRAWLDSYVAGVNFYKDRLGKDNRPHAMKVLGMGDEPWTALDTLTLGRLAGTDVNWLSWFNLLPLLDDPKWPEIWRYVLTTGRQGVVSFDNEEIDHVVRDGSRNPELQLLADLLLKAKQHGSNSIVVSGRRSAGGGALIANDPHLGLNLPNLWLAAGLKSPSYHIVGLTAPGVPAFGFGRTPHIAWGGTNMRTLASDLVDVGGLPESAFTTETHHIEQRWWFDTTATNRMSPYGPVISDAELLPNPGGRQYALHWLGHKPSDEITGLLLAAKARNWEEFKAAFDDFAMPGQNFLYVDTQGNIGHILAAKLPKRTPDHAQSMIVSPEQFEESWSDILNSRRLPSVFNPDKGYLASANNRPTDTDFPISYFFGPDERIRRLRQLSETRKTIDVEYLSNIVQTDTLSLTDLELKDELVERLAGMDLSVKEKAGLLELQAWDGRFEADSKGAAAYEAFLTSFSQPFYADQGLSAFFDSIKDSIQLRDHLLKELPTVSDATLQAAAKPALATAGDAAGKGTVWGDLHRYELQHILGNLPLVGRWYKYDDLPAPGSQETVLKTAHPLTDERHSAFYGSQARHISDMADPDANWFVLLGGQDERVGSDTFADQAELWKQGRYMRLPLTPEETKKEFATQTIIKAVGKPTAEE